MRRTRATGPVARRFAAVIALLGMLVTSSGLALLATAGPAGAATSGSQGCYGDVRKASPKGGPRGGCDDGCGDWKGNDKVAAKDRGGCGGCGDWEGPWNGNDKLAAKDRGGCGGCGDWEGPWNGNDKLAAKGCGGCNGPVYRTNGDWKGDCGGCDGPVILQKGKPGKHHCDPEPACGDDEPPVILEKRHAEEVECVVPTDPGFVDPTCDTDPQVILPSDPPVEESASKKSAGPVVLVSDAGGVHYVATGNLAPGGTVEIDATAIAPAVIEEGAPTHWEHTFTTPENCETVVEPPVIEPTVVVAPTVVEAGLVGDVAATVDPRGEQGRILVALGMALLVLAGGLGLRPSRANRR